MNALTILEVTARCLGAIAILQAIEFYLMRRDVLEVWPWKDLEPELGKGFSPLLRDESFVAFNVVRMIVGLLTLIFPSALLVALLGGMHILTLLRWLGTFNGGSDYMNLLLLWTCALGLAIPHEMAEVCLYYVTFQLCFSYFRAGWIKLKNRRWRDGSALRAFIQSPIYGPSGLTGRIVLWSRLFSWMVILFELTFPLSLIHQNVALVYMALGFLFHAGNVYIFGLNRFLFTWAAAYPALYFASLHRP